MGRGRRQGRDAVQNTGHACGGAGGAEAKGDGACEAVTPVGATSHAGRVEDRLPDGWGESLEHETVGRTRARLRIAPERKAPRWACGASHRAGQRPDPL